MGDKLMEAEEILFRQVHPSYFDGGEPSSQPFKPTPKDDNKLSVDRSKISTAEDSFKHFTGCGFASAGVYGLTVSEFASEKIDCLSDPLEANGDIPPNPAHAVADYSPHKAASHKNIAKRLKRTAVLRGCLYPPLDA